MFVDADGATRFSDLDLLVKAVGTKENAIAIGSRAHMVGTDAVVKVCPLQPASDLLSETF